jgi:hypothetical protein
MEEFLGFKSCIGLKAVGPKDTSCSASILNEFGRSFFILALLRIHIPCPT